MAIGLFDSARIGHFIVCRNSLYSLGTNPLSVCGPFNCNFKLMRLFDEYLIFLLDNKFMRRETVPCNKHNINTYHEVYKYFWLKCVDNCYYYYYYY